MFDTSKILGSGSPGISLNINTGDIAQQVKQVLQKIPNLEGASGKILLKIKGQPQRTVTFTVK